MNKFKAVIKIIGINPYVDVPHIILAEIFCQAGKDKGPIPVCGILNDIPYRQTLVRYRGEWRLYINTAMLKGSTKRLGEMITLTIAADQEVRCITAHPKLLTALAAAGNYQVHKLIENRSRR